MNKTMNSEMKNISQPINNKTKKQKSIKRSLLIKRILIYAVLIFIFFLCIIPFYIMIINATRASPQIQQGFSFIPGDQLVNNWNSMMSMSSIQVGRAVRNSLLISSITSFLTTYFSALTAYSIFMYRFKGRNFAFMFILFVMMIPNQISALGLVAIAYKINMVNTIIPLVIPAIASPVTFFYIKQYMESVLNKELIESARIDGAGEIRIFHRMVLPIMKPALAVQFIFAFVSSWNNFFLPSLILTDASYQTIPLIFNLLRSSNPATFDLGLIYMLLTVAILPLLVVYLLFSKMIISGLTAGSVKG
ncbi:MAG: carbohydrate ABC transporter permease [Bacilli bacterium]|jgi:multiple sugar transport system permease protein|nr:carbohydrate ABC transporter permease [Bacilli bacterium]